MSRRAHVGGLPWHYCHMHMRNVWIQAGCQAGDSVVRVATCAEEPVVACTCRLPSPPQAHYYYYMQCLEDLHFALVIWKPILAWSWAFAVRVAFVIKASWAASIRNIHCLFGGRQAGRKEGRKEGYDEHKIRANIRSALALAPRIPHTPAVGLRSRRAWRLCTAS
jgi:hypothetical protein